MGPIERQAGRLLEQLERATARLEAAPPDDIQGIAVAMRERSEAILALRELVTGNPPEPAPTSVLDGLREQLAATGKIARKLLLVRASLRAELAGLLEAGFLTRSLAHDAARAPHIDCQG